MDRAVADRQLAKARSLSSSDSADNSDSDPTSEDSDSSETEDDSVPGESEEEEDREAENSYLSPLYTPAPGGLTGGYGSGYGSGYGPYIYILPIVLPPAGRLPHHPPGPGPAARHVVTETGHESHHYQYQPLYAGSYGGERINRR